MKDKRKVRAAMRLNKRKHPHQANMQWFISDEKNFLPGSDGVHKEQLLAFSIPTRYTNCDQNQAPIYIKMFRLVTDDADLMLPYLFIHGLWLNMKAYIYIYIYIYIYVARVCKRLLSLFM